MKVFVVWFVILAFLPLAHSQDVYNFFLQKEQASKHTEPSSSPGSTAIESKEPIASSVQQTDHQKWAIYLGAGVAEDLTQRVGRSIIGSEYYFTKYWGVNGQLLLARKAPMNSEGASTRPEMAVGIHLKPVRLKFIDTELMDFSALVGVLTSRSSSHSIAIHRQLFIVPYWGLGIGFNFTRSISLLGQVRINNYGNVHQTVQGWGALAYRF